MLLRQYGPMIWQFKDESESQGSNFFGFLNQLGIIGSGVLGALYVLEQKDKAATGSQVEAVRFLSTVGALVDHLIYHAT
jgi:hypothetical protein